MCILCNINSNNTNEAVVYEDEEFIIAVTLHQKINNKGALMVFPRKNYENIYEINPEILSHLAGIVQKASIALKKSLQCDGITVIQNNEKAAGQDLPHFHVHVIPRYPEDGYYQNKGVIMDILERQNLRDIIKKDFL